MAVIDRVIMKGRCVVVPGVLQQQAFEQLHINYMGIEKTQLLMHESFYLIGMNANIENHIKLFYMPCFSENPIKRKVYSS